MNYSDKITRFKNMSENVDVNISKPPTNLLFYNKTKSGKYFWENDTEPTIWVSMLIPSYNTNNFYLVECVKSIKEQIGTFGLDLVWIDDCSSLENTNFLIISLYKKKKDF